jgi:hypothetical protein
LRRTDDGIALPMYDIYGNPSGEHLKCHVCHHDYERPDMIKAAVHAGYICSLCLSTDKTGEHVLPEQTSPVTARTINSQGAYVAVAREDGSEA